MNRQRATLATGILAALLFSGAPAAARGPDPLFASLLSAGSTALPVAAGSALLFTGRGAKEGMRLDLGLAIFGVGSIVGPSVGQFYAGSGGDAVVTLLLRTLTGALMVIGMRFNLRPESKTRGTGTALSLLGGVPTGLLGIYDIFGAHSTAVETRRERGYGPKTAALSSELLSIARCGPIPCGL